MKLSTKSRYGTRLMIDLAEHYNQAPVQISSIADRQGISIKYLEQIIIPLKKANFIESVRGPKGGHMLSRPPEEIKMGDLLYVLEEGMEITQCLKDSTTCKRADNCKSRRLWEMATKAMYDKLNSFKLSEIINEDCINSDKQKKRNKENTGR